MMIGSGAAGALMGGVTEGYVTMGSGLILAISGALFYFSTDSDYQKSIAQRKAECDATRNLWMTELDILRAEQGLRPEPNPGAEAESDPSQDPVENEQADQNDARDGTLYDAPVSGPGNDVIKD